VKKIFFFKTWLGFDDNRFTLQKNKEYGGKMKNKMNINT